MSQIQYTICRSGRYYYNKRVPIHAVKTYGSFIRQALSKCPEKIVGLKLGDIDLENDLIHIRPNTARRVKTRNSQRILPLVGYGRLAMEEALKHSHGEYLFPRYILERLTYELPNLLTKAEHINFSV